MVRVHINGKDLFQTYGASLGESSLVQLMKPVPLKPYLENKSMADHGKQVLINEEDAPVLKDERTLSLVINIEGSTQSDMLSRWHSLVDELSKGWVRLSTDIEPNIVYNLLYEDCTQLRTYFNRLASFTFKFNEPNPDNRR